jgi:hypothetical protein
VDNPTNYSTNVKENRFATATVKKGAETHLAAEAVQPDTRAWQHNAAHPASVKHEKRAPPA